VIEAIRSDGSPCATCSSSESLSFRAQMDNTCSEELRFYTTTSCLVSTWSVTSADGSVTSVEATGCSATATEWLLIPGGRFEDTVSWGTLSDGSYTIGALFGDEAAHTASSTINVSP